MTRIVLLLLALAPVLLGAERIVPFEFYANAIWLPARVNGSAPLHFLLDTAAGATVLNRSVIDRLKLPALSEFDQPNAGSGDNPARITHLPRLRVEFADITIDLPRGVAVPLDAVANSYGAAMDGIIGADLMRRYVVRIDFDARTLTLTDPAEFNYRGPGAILPLDTHTGVPIVRATIRVPGRPSIKGAFLVDAPYPGVVQFATPFSRQQDLVAAVRALTPSMPTTRGIGVGGPIYAINGRLESIQLGPYVMRLPTAVFPNAKAGAFARTDIAGILGDELLRRFHVTLDYSRNRMILEPAASFKEPFESDSSGLTVTSVGPPHREFRFAVVSEGTPGAEAGIRAGDEILEFDGRPAAELTVWAIRTLLRKPDREYQLKLRRGQEVLRVVLKTRRLT